MSEERDDPEAADYEAGWPWHWDYNPTDREVPALESYEEHNIDNDPV